MDSVTKEKNMLFELFLKSSKEEIFPKHSMLVKEGEFCKKIYLVKKGTLRFFYYNEQGDDITHWFLVENSFITEIDSFLQQKPSSYYIETLEDCELQSISYLKFGELSSIFPEMEKFWNVILSDYLIELGDKIKDLQFRDAKTRYENLLNKHPDILQRSSLGHIASYLGITQQSLSRIRKIK